MTHHQIPLWRNCHSTTHRWLTHAHIVKMYGKSRLINSSPCHSFYEFCSGTVTVREAGKCSATVSHRSDSASMCAARRQPELLRFHLDHSSLPRMRMLKLTGLSFSSSVSCSQALLHLLLLERRSSAHSLFVSLRHWPASLLCFCFFFPVALVSRLCSVVLSILSSPRRLPFPLSFLPPCNGRKWRLRMGQTQWR